MIWIKRLDLVQHKDGTIGVCSMTSHNGATGVVTAQIAWPEGCWHHSAWWDEHAGLTKVGQVGPPYVLNFEEAQARWKEKCAPNKTPQPILVIRPNTVSDGDKRAACRAGILVIESPEPGYVFYHGCPKPQVSESPENDALRAEVERLRRERDTAIGEANKHLAAYNFVLANRMIQAPMPVDSATLERQRWTKAIENAGLLVKEWH